MPRGSSVRVTLKLDHQGLAAFLLSQQLYDATAEATRDIAVDAKALAPGDTQDYRDSIKAEDGGVTRPAMNGLDGNPRRAGVVTAHGGGGTERNPEGSVAVALEFGNAKTSAKRVLGRAGDPYHTPLTKKRR